VKWLCNVSVGLGGLMMVQFLQDKIVTVLLRLKAE